MTAKRRAAAAAVLAGALALAGCVAAPGEASPSSLPPSPAPTSTTTATPTAPPSAVPTRTPEPSRYPTADTISCDTMLDPALDAELRAQGLFPAPKEFNMPDFTPTLPAIECPWGVEGDFHSYVYYTWAQLAPGERDLLLASETQNGATVDGQADGSTWMHWGADGNQDAFGIMLTDEWAVGAPSMAAVPNVVWTR